MIYTIIREYFSVCAAHISKPSLYTVKKGDCIAKLVRDLSCRVEFTNLCIPESLC